MSASLTQLCLLISCTVTHGYAILHRCAHVPAPDRRHAHVAITMVAETAVTSEDEAEPAVALFCYGLPGAIAPANEFDPAGLLNGKSKAEVYMWRESELAHGRVAMTASAGFVVQEFFHPLGDNLPALEQLFHLPDPLLFAIPTVIGFCETARSQRWTGNEVIRNVLPTSPDGKYLGAYPGDIGYYPGDLGFDPLGLKPEDPAEFRIVQEKELANGRLGMLAAVGFFAQEAVSGRTWASF